MIIFSVQFQPKKNPKTSAKSSALGIQIYLKRFVIGEVTRCI